MTPEQIDNILLVNAGKFSPEALETLRLRMLDADETTVLAAIGSLKSTEVMLVVSVLIGTLGIDRFLLGDTLLGVLKLITGGGCCIWTIIDWFTISDRTRQYNTKTFLSKLS